MADNRLDQLADDVGRLIAALEAVVREREELRRRVRELEQRAAQPGTPYPEQSPPPVPAPDAVPPPAGSGRDGDDALMEHIELLETERAAIRERLTRLLRHLEEVDLAE